MRVLLDIQAFLLNRSPSSVTIRLSTLIPYGGCGRNTHE